MSKHTPGLKDLMDASPDYQRGFWDGVHKVEGLLDGIKPEAAPEMLEALKYMAAKNLSSEESGIVLAAIAKAEEG